MILRLIILSLALSCVFTQINYDYSGNILFGTINRTSDASLIKVPFRFINYKPIVEYGNFNLTSHFALELNINNEMKNNFSDKRLMTFSGSFDLRELYISWFPDDWEIKLGKQINTWGVGSTNSPLDILTPVNYYYFFSRGIEKNIGSLSLNMKAYSEDQKFQIIYIPGHTPHYLPLGDPEMPITIDSLPENLKIQNINKPQQLGVNFETPIHNIDFTFSYFTGYDHLMSLFGASTWTDNAGKLIAPYEDPLLSFRNTEVLGIGLSTFIGDMRVNTEIAFYNTSDEIKKDEDILRDYNGEYADICFPEQVEVDLILGNPPCFIVQDLYFGVATTANYYEYLIEFEYPNLFFDITLLGQFLSYNLLNISDGLHPNGTPSQIGRIDFTTRNNFIPTLGSPIFMFTMHEDEETETMYMHNSSVFYLNAKRFFMDNNLEANLRTFYDIKNHGNLIEIEFKYNLSSKINISTAINKISGNSNLNNSYTFNAMENFSHFRLEATYNF